MKKIIRNILIILLPFFLMVCINEMYRPFVKSKSHRYKSLKTINSADKNKVNCTWMCHSNTAFCKKYHVKYLKPLYKYTDGVYFGFIALLRSTGNYGVANILLFVIISPLFVWYFIIKVLNLKQEINNLKR